MIKDRIVKTYDGTKASRKNCIRIKDNDGKFKYWIKHKQCFRINDTWFKVTNPNMVKDHNDDSYFHTDYKPPSITRGVVNSNLDEGYFTKNPFKNTTIIDMSGNVKTALNADIPKTLGYYEDNTRNRWSIKKGDVQVDKIAMNDSFPISLGYNAKNSLSEFTALSKSFPITESDYKLASLVDGLSFGFEFETYGFIPLPKLAELGLIPLRDGSVSSGVEYTSIILEGPQGMAKLRNMMDVLNKRTKATSEGSLHIHVGNIDTSPTGLLVLYKLIYKVQDQLYKMFPEYKKDGSIKHRSGSNKGYSEMIPSCGTTYNIKSSDVNNKLSNIINFLSDGTEDNYNGETRVHPKDPSGNHKWRINSRYTGINFVNMVYSSAKTLEFRLHQSTTNKDKVINWMLIVAALVKYSKKYSSEILSNDVTFNLDTILHSVYPTSIASRLMDYYNDRASYFKSVDINSDPLCDVELKYDKKFNFKVI